MNLVFFGASLITLVATPWVNSDALIVPKVILLCALAFILLPSLIRNLKVRITDNKIKFLVLISIAFILNMLFAMLLSEAPFEQEFFGRTGRGLGFITFTSLFIVMIYTALRISNSNLNQLNGWIFLSCFISSIYSLLQYFGFDVFDWRTQTNGIIGTIGNPNFQSSFVAMAFIPSLVYVWNGSFKFLNISSVSIFFIFVLYICQSTQGWIAIFASIFIFILIYHWFKANKLYFWLLLILFFILSTIAIAGMLNKGPLNYYLYKVSVRSRGEMWDTAFAIIRDNPLFGVGLDSLGDYSLAYQSEKTANGIAEYIDNVHNFLLQFAATGGVSLALIYATLVLAVGYLFLNKIFTMDRFEIKIVALFCAWISFQLQSLISPAAIPTLVWNFIICGVIIGLQRADKISDLPKNNKSNNLRTNSKINEFINFKCFISVTIAVTLTFPLFSADKLAREANLKGDANLALRAATKYPESVIRYNRLGADLYNAGLYDLSLEIGRDAVKFNPNSYLTWILILLNPNAPIPERQIAKNELIRIAPHNKDIQNYSFESISGD